MKMLSLFAGIGGEFAVIERGIGDCQIWPVAKLSGNERVTYRTDQDDDGVLWDVAMEQLQDKFIGGLM